MIDRVKAFREPATIVAIVVVLLGVAVTSGRIATELRTTPWAEVLRGATGLYGLVDGLVLTLLALSCVLVAPATRHAQQLTLAAALLLWLGAAVGLAFLLVSVVSAPESPLSRLLDSVGGLTDVALRALMGYALLLGRRAAAAPAPSPDGPPAVPAQAGEQDAGDEPSRRPIWQPDEATGVVWRSASDAASGAAAGTYSSSGSGWGVPPEAAELPPARQSVNEQPTSPRIVRSDTAPPTPGDGRGSWDPATDLTRRDREPPENDEKPPD